MNKRTFTLFLLITIVSILFALIYIGYPRWVAEKTIENKITKTLGPSINYKVNISNTGFIDIFSGNLKKVNVEGERIVLENGLVLNKLFLELINLRFSTKKLKSIEKINFTIKIDEKNITKYLRKKELPVEDIEVKILPEKAIFSGLYKAMGIKIDVSLSGTFVIEGNSKVIFFADKFELGELNIPAEIVNTWASQINPIFDTNDLDYNAQIKEIKLEPENIVIAGTIEPAPFVDN